MLKDLAIGLRRLRREPVFALVVAVTLALGIGLNSVISGVVYRVLIRPLPFPDEDSLVFVRNFDRRSARAVSISPADVFALRESAASFAELGAFTRSQLNVLLEDGAERVAGGVVTEGFFQALGLRPLLGRAFQPEDFLPGSEAVLLLREGFWRDRLGGDPEVLDRSMEISGDPYRIVGVMPDELRLGGVLELWLPLAIEPLEASRTSRYLRAVGRLRDGVSIGEAASECDLLAQRLAEEFPTARKDLGLTVEPLREALNRGSEAKLMALWAAAGLLVLLVCSNLTLLVLVRLTHRRSEMAVRLALGATRWRAWRQLAVEMMVLAVAGGILGVAAAGLFTAAAERLRAGNLPELEPIVLDGPTLAFTLASSLLVGVLMASLGAASLRLPNLGEGSLAGSRAASGSPSSMRLQKALVAAQVALALVLLTGAGLMLRSLRALSSVDPGFDLSGTVVSSVVFPSIQYPPGSPQLEAYLRQALARLEALPGVDGAASGILAPLSGSAFQRQVSLDDGADPERAEGMRVQQQAVSAGYFRVRGVEVLRGRVFLPHENDGVAVVNDRFSREILGGGDPLGRRLVVRGPLWPEPRRLEIVGVVESELLALDEEPAPAFYVPHELELAPFATFYVRTHLPAAQLVPAVQESLRELDPGVAGGRPTTMEAILAESMVEERSLAQLLAVFAGLALLLAVVGVYGVFSLLVSRRRREFGVRQSLGATPQGILLGVVADALRVAAAGVIAGLVAAWALTGRMADLLFEVSPTDPASYAAVAGVLLVTAVLASWLPARRAGRVPLAETLRVE